LLLYAPHASLPARVRTSWRQQTNKHTAAANKQTRGAASAQAHEPLSRHPSGGPQTKHSTKPASDRPKRTQTCAHEYAQAVAGVRTRTCEHVHARTHACAAVHVRACTSMRNCFAHARTCAHTNVRIRAQAHACMRARKRALVHVRTHEGAFARRSAYSHASSNPPAHARTNTRLSRRSCMRVVEYLRVPTDRLPVAAKKTSVHTELRCQCTHAARARGYSEYSPAICLL
jgi:hypothetical protein